jgi:hypothetical protein
MMLKGLSAFPITPCGSDGRVDTGALRRLLAPLLAAKVTRSAFWAAPAPMRISPARSAAVPWKWRSRKRREGYRSSPASVLFALTRRYGLRRMRRPWGLLPGCSPLSHTRR